MDKNKIEQTFLKRSVYGSLFMVILGIVFAFLTRSEAILLDGAVNEFPAEKWAQ